MNTKKKILSIALAASLAAVAVVGSSLAYFTDTDEKDNVYTIGNVDIVLSEPGWDATGEDEAQDMYPGEAVAKDPTVTNVGANPCFVRVKVEGLGDDFTYRTKFQDNKLGDGWSYNAEDEYFYYAKILGTATLPDYSSQTTPLFDQIVLNTNVENGNGEAGHIVVTAEAVQAQGAKTKFADVEKMTVAEIADWFEVCMKE